MSAKYKNKLLALGAIFIITGCLAAWTIVKRSSRTSFETGATDIAFVDTSSIYKISVKSPDSDEVIVERAGEGHPWVVNGRYRVRAQLAAFLVFGLHKLEVKRPVSQNSKSKVIHQLEGQGLLVKVSSREEEKQFYVMTNPNDINSSYLWEKGTGSPYIVYVPGVKGDISNLLKLKANDWRIREIFSSTPRTLQSVKITYRERRGDDFEIRYEDGGYKVHGMDDVDTVKLKKYLGLFQLLGAEQYVDSDSVKMMLDKRRPDVVIRLEDIDPKKNNQLQLYFIPAQNKIFGTIEKSKEVVLLNPQVFKFVLVNKKYFHPKPANNAVE